jgi:hypothetical protein
MAGIAEDVGVEGENPGLDLLVDVWHEEGWDRK